MSHLAGCQLLWLLAECMGEVGLVPFCIQTYKLSPYYVPLFCMCDIPVCMQDNSGAPQGGGEIHILDMTRAAVVADRKVFLCAVGSLLTHEIGVRCRTSNFHTLFPSCLLSTTFGNSRFQGEIFFFEKLFDGVTLQ